MKYNELKKQCTDTLHELGGGLTKTQIAFLMMRMGISGTTVINYISGDSSKVRNLELAEKLIDEISELKSTEAIN